MKNETLIGVPFSFGTETELRAIKKKGVDYVRLEETWRYTEPKYEHYDFTRSLAVLQQAEEINLGVVFEISMEPQPAWLIQEAAGLNCWENPLLAKTAERYLKALVKFIGKSGAMKSWILRLPATTTQCTCKHALEAFRAFMKAKYKTLDALNAQLRQNVAEWDHLHPNHGGAQMENEWIRFGYEAQQSTYASFVRLIQKCDKDARPVTLSYGALPTEELAVPTFVHLLRNHDTGARSEDAVWTADLPIGTPSFGMWRSLPPTQKSTINATFAALSLGASKLLFPQPPSAELLNFLRSSDQFLSACAREPAEVAVFASKDAAWLAAQSGSPHLVDDCVTNLMTACVARSVFPDLLQDLTAVDLTKYKLILLPAGFTIDQQQTAQLTAYVAQGGMLVSDGLAAAYDQVGNAVGVSHLAELFGCVENGYQPAPKHAVLTGVNEFATYSVAAKEFLQTFQLTNGKAAFQSEDGIAGVANAHGQGSTLVFGTLFSAGKISTDFLGTILDSASVKNLDLKVIVQSLISTDYWVVFAFNKEEKTSKFVLDETQGYTLVDSFGCQINTETFKVTVEGNAACCIIFKANEVTK